MQFLTETWISFKATVRGFDTPHQLALGIALGIWIGLIPKDSALPYVLAALAILTPANLICLALGIAGGSLLSPQLDSVTHEMGLATLTYAPCEPMWAWIYSLPAGPWTRINNTVVMGTTELGLLMMGPVYLVSRKLIQWLATPLYRLLVNSSVARRFVPSVNQLQES